MPIWLRNYTFNEIKQYYAEEAAAVEKAKEGSSSKGNKQRIDLANPNINDLPEQSKLKKLN